MPRLWWKDYTGSLLALDLEMCANHWKNWFSELRLVPATKASTPACELNEPLSNSEQGANKDVSQRLPSGEASTHADGSLGRESDENNDALRKKPQLEEDFKIHSRHESAFTRIFRCANKHSVPTT